MENTEFILGPIQEEWLKSLEEHPERQWEGALGGLTNPITGEYKACCLGELGLIAAKHGMGNCQWKGNVLLDIDKESPINNSSATLYSSYAELGLRGACGNMKIDNGEYSALSSMNDDGYSWPQIAAEVRKNPEKFFTKSY